MSDTEELKPCPSGLSDRGHTAPIWNAGSGKWHCECACGWRANEADDVAGAYSFWNRRSPPGVETEGQIAALEKMLERASKIGSSRQLNDLIPEMRALLSTSSRGEDLSSRDKRASLPASDGRPSVDLPLEDARQEHIELMVKAAADWLLSDDTPHELDPPSARRAAWGMLQAAFSIVPGPNVVKGPIDTRGAQDVKR